MLLLTPFCRWGTWTSCSGPIRSKWSLRLFSHTSWEAFLVPHRWPWEFPLLLTSTNAHSIVIPWACWEDTTLRSRDGLLFLTESRAVQSLIFLADSLFQGCYNLYSSVWFFVICFFPATLPQVSPVLLGPVPPPLSLSKCPVGSACQGLQLHHQRACSAPSQLLGLTSSTRLSVLDSCVSMIQKVHWLLFLTCLWDYLGSHLTCLVL